MYTFIVNTRQLEEPGRTDRAKLLLGRLLLLGQGLDDLLLLCCETLFSALTSLLCLGTTSLGLITVGQRNKVRLLTHTLQYQPIKSC